MAGSPKGSTGLWPVWLGCAVVLGHSVHLMAWYWPGSAPLDITSGVWTALARDFADGVLYRPLLSDIGYGGTRYMPLFIITHGTLIRFGMDPILAGVQLTIISVALFDSGLYFILRR